MNEKKNFDYKRLHPFKWYILENFPFLEDSIDVLTNYQLFCKLGEMYNKEVDAINTLGVQVEGITDWFDDLDVQDEVNNKLDEMAESGVLEEIIGAYINANAVLGFDTLADLKVATNLIDGSFAQTLGYYTKNDGGKGLYKIRNITNADIVDEMRIIALNDQSLIAELIETNVNAKQIGCKTDGTDNSTLLNNYFTKYGDGLYFPNGNYSIAREVDTIGNVIMDNKAYLVATSSMDCCVHINKNVTYTDFVDTLERNQKLIINVNANKLGDTGIRTDKLHMAKLDLTVINAITYGVYTKYGSSGHAENNFNINISNTNDYTTNNTTGVYIRGTDDYYENITTINCKTGVHLRGGGNTINAIHSWLNKSELWSGSVTLKIVASKNHINTLISDTMEKGIYLENNSVWSFTLVVDYFHAMINESIVNTTLGATFEIFDCSQITEQCRNNSSLIITNYTGQDTNTVPIRLGGNGICPNNTILGYNNEYEMPKWNYSLNYAPQGNFLFKGSTNVTGKPNGLSSSDYGLITRNLPYGKEQEIVLYGQTVGDGYTQYDSNFKPTTGYVGYYKRVYNKYGTGSNTWGAFASYQAQIPTT